MSGFVEFARASARRLGIGRARGVESSTARIAHHRGALRELDPAALVSRAKKLSGGSPAQEQGDDRVVRRLALACEAARRGVGLDPYATQVQAALVLLRGQIAEMQTGEGKTLAAALAACTDVLTGRRVHVLTANDYLAERDCAWMAPVYALLGLTAAYRRRGQDGDARKSAHAADIVYGTAAEFAFDFLMDSFRAHADAALCGGFDVAIFDEADHILIDEASNPLIITADAPAAEEICRAVAVFAGQLGPGDVEIDSRLSLATLSDSGLEAVERWLAEYRVLSTGHLYDAPNLDLANRVNQALRARFVMIRDHHYVVRDGGVLVLDLKTGRTTRGRFAEGLHQAIEAKEGTPISPEQHQLASITMRSFAQLYDKRSGVTATASRDAGEFGEVYGLSVVEIPPRLPSLRVDRPDSIFATDAERLQAVLAMIEARHARGQPILVGTRGIAMSEAVSNLLRARSIRHNVLHAHFDASEAAIVAEAGKFAAVTVATNMAGRGTDIELGGRGSVAIEASAGEAALERARVVAVGGLLVIGIERQSLRRLDDQLRGRAGRQGDPGESMFFLSREDELFLDLAARGGRLREEAMDRFVAKRQELNRRAGAEVRREERAYGDIVDRQRKVWSDLRAEFLQAAAAPNARVLSAAAEFSGLDEENHSKLAGLTDADLAATSDRLVAVMDTAWRSHLAGLDSLRTAIGLRVHGERDPKSEYRTDALASFEAMLEHVRSGFRDALAGSTHDLRGP